MTDERPPPSAYIPSLPAAIVAVVLSIGIIGLAVRDSFTTDYDARQTIGMFCILIGGTLGFDYRRGKLLGNNNNDAPKNDAPPAAGPHGEDPPL